MERVFAACAPGLEELLAAELSGLGLSATTTPGGAEAEGPQAVALACLGSRLADAVSLRLYAGPASGLPQALAAGRARFGAAAELQVRRRGGEATVSIDACGGPLYKRGWRARAGAAPLRETLAAALLAFADHDGAQPLLDPMCGSGTIAIEGALRAARRPPGAGRRFAYETWPGRDREADAAVRSRLTGAERAPAAPVWASDRNGGAVRLAAKNAEAAGVAAWVRVQRADAAALLPPPGPGLLAVNPPYGSRLEGDPAAAWRALAELLPRLRGWRLALVAPDRGLEKLLGLSPSGALATRNGGMACLLLRYQL